MVIPSLTIRHDADRDADKVWHFLHHPKSPVFARYITNLHPELGSISDDERAVRQWVTSWHVQHAPELATILQVQERIISEKGTAAFTLLGEKMEYEWPAGTSYTAYFSLLPFSPFEGNDFYYSVIQDVAGRNSPGRSVLSVGVHEISHFIFFMYVRSIQKDTGWLLHQDAANYLKEALTTVILNTPEFLMMFGTERSGGNPELSELHIQASPVSLIIVPWLERQYLNSRDGGTAFSTWLTNMIAVFHSKEHELSAHMSIWKKNGPNLHKDQTLLSQYREPISIGL